MRLRWLAILVTLVCCGQLPAVGYGSRGSIDGVFEWRYGKHTVDESDKEVHDANWFTQKYSLVYHTGDGIVGGRVGSYNLSLGYEWLSLDGAIDGQSTDVSTGKVLYQGDLVIAPGGLPLTLHLYSHDLNSSSFSAVSAAGLFERLPGDRMPTPETVIGLQNGRQSVTGFTLMAGAASGDYEGIYRDVLANAPRLLIDYRQHDIRDLKSTTPQHYRDRNLAFVSLNKKDNWFHYRIYDHKDYLNPEEDYVEKVFILGTIDHTLQRRWVRLTNWIEVSADASYTTTNELSRGDNMERSYDINLFTVAHRRGWQAANFSTYRREFDGTSRDRALEFPVYISKQFDPETSLRTRFVAEFEDSLLFAEDKKANQEVVFLSNRLELRQRQPWTLTGQFDVEHKSGDDGNGLSARALVETATNRLFRPQYDLFGAYSLAYFSGEGAEENDVRDETVGFWEQTLVGRIETDLTPNYRTGFTQEFLYGSGTLDRRVGDYINPKSDLGLMFSGGEVEQRDGSVLRSTTTWFGEYRGSSQITSRLELTYDCLNDEERKEDVFIASHRLRYDSRRFYATLQNRLITGSHRVSSGGLGASSIEGDGTSGEADYTLENRLYLMAYPLQDMEASLRIDHDWRSFRNGDSHQYLIEQRLRYYLRRGISGRNIALLGQEFLYERVDSLQSQTRSARTLTLIGEIYPTIRTLLGVRLRYRYLEPEDTTTYTGYLTAGINWEKLQISVDYAYGTRGEGETDPERVEHRWEVKARKIF